MTGDEFEPSHEDEEVDLDALTASVKAMVIASGMDEAAADAMSAQIAGSFGPMLAGMKRQGRMVRESYRLLLLIAERVGALKAGSDGRLYPT